MEKVDKNKPVTLGLLLDATDHVVERLGKMLEDNQKKNDRNFAKLGVFAYPLKKVYSSVIRSSA